MPQICLSFFIFFLKFCTACFYVKSLISFNYCQHVKFYESLLCPGLDENDAQIFNPDDNVNL